MATIWQRLIDLPRHLSVNEKRLLIILFGALIITGGFVVSSRSRLLNQTPTYGGQYTEGLVGHPLSLNPLTTTSSTDKAVLSLLYPGLTSLSSDGTVTPRLAESWEVSDEGKTYTFFLRENLHWHDGAPLTTGDIAYTIERVLDPETKSPAQINWDGVTVEVVDDHIIKFKLDAPNAPFLTATNLPILPLHIPLNEIQQKLIGSGPFRYQETAVENNQISQIKLVSNHDWFEGRPYLDQINFRFYNDLSTAVAAYNKGEIDSLLEETAAATHPGQLRPLATQRFRLLFFNTERPALQPLEKRQKIWRGEPVDPTSVVLVTHESLQSHPALVSQIAQWSANGMTVEVQALESLALLDRLESHDYDLLFVDVDMKGDFDRYPLYHSSQRNGLGLNFSLVNDESLDRLLETSRATLDIKERQRLAQEVDNKALELAVVKNLEQVTSYWWLNERVKGVPEIQSVVGIEDRFNSVTKWFVRATALPETP